MAEPSRVGWIKEGETEQRSSTNWASNNVTNILMEADAFSFMQPKHFTALEEEECLIQPDGEKS